MSGMKGALEAPPYGRPFDGRFVHALNEPLPTRRTGSALRACNRGFQSVPRSDGAKLPRTRSVGGSDHMSECETRKRVLRETEDRRKTWSVPYCYCYCVLKSYLSKASMVYVADKRGCDYALKIEPELVEARYCICLGNGDCDIESSKAMVQKCAL